MAEGGDAIALDTIPEELRDLVPYWEIQNPLLQFPTRPGALQSFSDTDAARIPTVPIDDFLDAGRRILHWNASVPPGAQPCARGPRCCCATKYHAPGIGLAFRPPPHALQRVLTLCPHCFLLQFWAQIPYWTQKVHAMNPPPTLTKHPVNVLQFDLRDSKYVWDPTQLYEPHHPFVHGWMPQPNAFAPEFNASRGEMDYRGLLLVNRPTHNVYTRIQTADGIGVPVPLLSMLRVSPNASIRFGSYSTHTRRIRPALWVEPVNGVLTIRSIDPSEELRATGLPDLIYPPRADRDAVHARIFALYPAANERQRGWMNDILDASLETETDSHPLFGPSAYALPLMPCAAFTFVLGRKSIYPEARLFRKASGSRGSSRSMSKVLNDRCTRGDEKIVSDIVFDALKMLLLESTPPPAAPVGMDERRAVCAFIAHARTLPGWIGQHNGAISFALDFLRSLSALANPVDAAYMMHHYGTVWNRLMQQRAALRQLVLNDRADATQALYNSIMSKIAARNALVQPNFAIPQRFPATIRVSNDSLAAERTFLYCTHCKTGLTYVRMAASALESKPRRRDDFIGAYQSVWIVPDGETHKIVCNQCGNVPTDLELTESTLILQHGTQICPVVSCATCSRVVEWSTTTLNGGAQCGCMYTNAAPPSPIPCFRCNSIQGGGILLVGGLRAELMYCCPLMDCRRAYDHFFRSPRAYFRQDWYVLSAEQVRSEALNARYRWFVRKAREETDDGRKRARTQRTKIGAASPKQN